MAALPTSLAVLQRLPRCGVLHAAASLLPLGQVGGAARLVQQPQQHRQLPPRLHTTWQHRARPYTAHAQQTWTEDEGPAAGAAAAAAGRSSARAAAAADTAWHDSAHAPARRRQRRSSTAALSADSSSTHVSSRRRRVSTTSHEALAATAEAWPAVDARPAAGAAGPAERDVEAHVSGEGEVAYPEGGALQDSIARHWQALAACPSSQAYTRSISFDEFGVRYIAQQAAEEAARCRARGELAKATAADAARGASYRQPGGVLARLMAAWQPLLAEAVAEEQRCVMESGSLSAGRKDRPSYGPYLLMLPPEELANITLQTVLSHVATAVPGEDEGADDTSWAGSGAGGAAAYSSGLSSGGGRGGGGGGDGEGLHLAASKPAVLLADALGRGVNSRLHYLRFKAQAADHHHQRRHQQPGAGSSSSSSSDASAPVPGEALQQAMAEFVQAGTAEANCYKAGQARLAALAEQQGLSTVLRRSTERAMADLRWEPEVRLKVGAALLSLLMENSHLPDGIVGRRPHKWGATHHQARAAAGGAGGGSSSSSAASSASASSAAAFEYKYVKTGSVKQQAMVAASHGLIRVLLADRSLAASLLVKVPPMLIPPLPWSSYSTGGHLTSRHWMMRTRYSSAMKAALKEGMRRQQYNKVLDALNVLGNTSWRINPAVHATLNTLWKQKSTAGGLPCQVPHKPPRPPPQGYRLLYEGGGLVARSGGWSRLERRGHMLGCDDVRRLNRNMASLKADFLLKKQVADDFSSAPEFFYPHTLDFRGRAYPLHPSLHHLGDDMCRGLLMFGRGRPLGRTGLDWLYVHLANVWGNGQDKTSFDDRRAFARANLATILDVALDPLANRWWCGAEKPWQALAACCEIAGALESASPSLYVSHLPVHMDGSCNGLQHYAALGRDEAGGTAVNLLPSARPQDVYKGVAEIVARRAAEDAAGGHSLARRCVGLIDRKVVKQTVMTSVYGVTSVGARAQVENRLREKRADMKARAALARASAANSSSSSVGSSASSASSSASSASSSGALLIVPGRDEYGWMDDKDVVWQVSKYLADQTLDAIGEMFVSARAIMGWLAECARVVSAHEAPVAWVSPLGLPIMQPYHKLAMTSVATTAQTFYVVSPGGDGSASSSSEAGSAGSGGGGGWMKARQRSAFPPNFIHSIDSTHMMMTALACNAKGIEFAGVHDSFWTHAGTVPLMNALLRDKFVELHTRKPDLLEDLLAQLQGQFPGCNEFPPIPERGHLPVPRVRNSRYFFS